MTLWLYRAAEHIDRLGDDVVSNGLGRSVAFPPAIKNEVPAKLVG